VFSQRWRSVETLPNFGAFGQMGVARDPKRTLQIMTRNVKEALRNRRVIEIAAAIVSDLKPRDYAGGLRAIDAFLRTHFKFVRDPFGQELLRRPEYLLHRMQTQGLVQGDCDDVAQLAAVLGMAIGYPAEFVAVSFDPLAKHYSHVFTVLRLPNGQGVHFDVTRPEQFANKQPPFTGGYSFPVM